MSPYLYIRPFTIDVALLLLGKILIPPLHEPVWSHHPVCLHSQFINGVIKYISKNGNLTPTNVILHFPHTRRLQGLYHQWPLPSPLPDSLIWHPCNPPSHLMVKPLQHLQYYIRHYTNYHSQGGVFIFQMRPFLALLINLGHSGHLIPSSTSFLQHFYGLKVARMMKIWCRVLDFL